MFMTDYLKRTAETRNHLCSVAKDCVLLGRGDEERSNKLLTQAIWESNEFKTLPKFQQTFIVGFVAGLKANELSPETMLPEIDKPIPEKEVPPPSVTKLQPGVTWRRHPNGGGWISETAYVEATAMVGAKAIVYENARVLDRAKIYGSARVFGDAECFGSCHVHGLAQVEGHAKVFDAARVLGRAIIRGTAEVGGSSLVRGNELISDGLVLDERRAPAQIKQSYTRELRKRVDSGPVARPGVKKSG